MNIESRRILNEYKRRLLDKAGVETEIKSLIASDYPAKEENLQYALLDLESIKIDIDELILNNPFLLELKL